MAFTFNGFGTRYYGTRWDTDGSYITTKWIVVIYVPIVPLGSVHVLDTGPVHGSAAYSGQSMVTQKVALDRKMVARIYGIIAAVLLFLIYGVPALNRLIERM